MFIRVNGQGETSILVSHGERTVLLHSKQGVTIAYMYVFLCYWLR